MLQKHNRARQTFRADEPERRLDRSRTFFTHDAAQYALDAVAAAFLSRLVRQFEFDRSRRMKRRALARVDPQPNR